MSGEARGQQQPAGRKRGAGGKYRRNRGRAPTLSRADLQLIRERTEYDEEEIQARPHNTKSMVLSPKIICVNWVHFQTSQNRL